MRSEKALAPGHDDGGGVVDKEEEEGGGGGGNGEEADSDDGEGPVTCACLSISVRESDAPGLRNDSLPGGESGIKASVNRTKS